MLYENDNFIITGSRTILDLDAVSLSHFMEMTPSIMKKMVVTSQVGIPSTAPTFQLVGDANLHLQQRFENNFKKQT